MMDKISVVSALHTAIPFVERFKGSTFVIKLGGASVADTATLKAIVEQIKILQILGMKIVIVHGGGDQATDLATRLGIETTRIGGRRVTDAGALEAVVFALNGKVNTEILAVARNVGLDAVGLSCASSSIVTAVKRPPVELFNGELSGVVDYGHVGDVEAVDVATIESLLDLGKVPVVSPLSADKNGNLLNINADTIAAAIGAALRAEKLIFVSAPRGLMASLADSTSLISLINVSELSARIESGEISDGMLPKVGAAMDALKTGVRDAHFVSYAMENSLLLEVLTSEGCGTKIVSVDDVATLEMIE